MADYVVLTMEKRLAAVHQHLVKASLAASADDMIDLGDELMCMAGVVGEHLEALIKQGRRARVRR
jgi:hypothetical protein